MYTPTLILYCMFLMGLCDGALIYTSAGIPPFPRLVHPTALVLAWAATALLTIAVPAVFCADSMVTSAAIPMLAAMHLFLGALAVAMRTLDSYLYEKDRRAADRRGD